MAGSISPERFLLKQSSPPFPLDAAGRRLDADASGKSRALPQGALRATGWSGKILFKPSSSHFALDPARVLGS
jgi:hypothetical protein